MYIRIINKNRIDTDNEYTDFVAFPIDEGCVYTQVYGEELDSFECRVSNIQSQLEIEPFDRVAIYDNNDTLLNVMDVENYVCDMQGYLGDTTYTYDISLCSMTKELENYILPNLSITPRKVSTRLTVQDYIERYINLFAPNIIIDPNMNFSNLAPELQWNEPTLREVLTSLMMTKDCIPIVKYDPNVTIDNEQGAIILSYMDLTYKGNEITGYNYVRSSRSMSDYNSELRMTMQNVMQPDNTVVTSEYIPFTTDGALLTEQNFYLETQFPILNIKHLWLGVYVAPDSIGNKYQFRYVDLCNIGNTTYDPNDNGTLVYEKSEYDTLNVLNRAISTSNVSSTTISNYFSKYQAYCVYFTRGGNKIEGFTDPVKRALLDASILDTTLNWIKHLLVVFGYSDTNAGINYDNSYYSTFFKIEYETMYDQVFQASKERQQSHHRVLVDNQQFSWVDANTQARLEYQKANRLGNDVVLINGRDMTIELGDTLNDNIVYKVEKQIYTDHTDINAYATKNYILRDKFTAIDAKIRTYVNAQNEAFIRSNLKKFYCVFQSFPKNDTSVDYDDLSQALVSPLDEQAHSESIKYVGVSTRTENRTQPSQTGYCFLQNCLSRQLGKSMVFSFGFNDNWVAGKFANVLGDTDNILELSDIRVSDGVGGKLQPTVDIQFTNDFGGIPLYNAPIGFEDGECDYIDYKFAHDMYVTSFNGTDYTSSQLYDATTDVAQNFAYDTFTKPYAKKRLINNFAVFSDSVLTYKDNKEIPMFNIQFEFISNDNDIMVTNKWVELQKWLNDYDTAKPYTIYSSPVANWNFRSNALPSDTTQLQGTTLQIDYSQNNRAKITLQGTDNQHCYYVVVDGEVVLGFVGKNDTTNIYMNILSKRDQNTYNAKGVIVNG